MEIHTSDPSHFKVEIANAEVAPVVEGGCYFTNVQEGWHVTVTNFI
jgi:hypothetical protein